MDVLNLDFIKNARGAGAGPSIRNDRFSLAVVQVEGTFSAVSLVLEGRVDPAGDWETIAGWTVSAPNVKTEAVTSVGIYEFPIEGIVELRGRVISVEGGFVSASGVLYDAARGDVWPQSEKAPGGITFGDPTLFVKGVAEQIFFDPSSGNIIGYDKTAADGAINITANLTEISGGMGNRLIGVLPDTARVTGTYTSAAFSLETRERIMGGEIAYNAVSQICETILADSPVLTVSNLPAPALGEAASDEAYWCYVRPLGGGTIRGENVHVDARIKEVTDYVAEAGKRYEVTYFTHRISAQMLPVPSLWNPVIMTVQEKFGVYSTQNGGAERGILKGWLLFIVPRAILNADAGANASQTSNADTGGSWLALTEKPENMPLCDCGENLHPMAYYVYVPCSGENDAVTDIVTVGRGLSVKAGQSAQIPVKLVMPDDSLIQPDFSTLGYFSEDESIATVDNRGVVTGVSEGETWVRAYVSKSDGSSLVCGTRVAVTGARAALASRPGNIIIE